jgi:hypothetical protein
MEMLPVVALVAMPKITDTCAPAAMVNGLAGLVVTPDGIPVKVICTEPVKPFSGVTVTLTAGLDAPCATETELGEKARRKSGAGGGWTTVVSPPPHPKHVAARSSRTVERAQEGERPM